MSDLTSKFGMLQEQLANQHTDIVALLQTIADDVSASREYSRLLLLANQGAANAFALLAQYMGDVRTNTNVLPDIHTKVVQLGIDATEINNKVNDTNDRLAQLLITAGLIKADTGWIDDIEERLRGYVSDTNTGDIHTRLDGVRNEILYLRSVFMDINNTTWGDNPIANYAFANYNNLLGAAESLQGILTRTGDTKVATEAALPLLEAIRDCSCDDETGTGVCADFTAELTGEADIHNNSEYGVTFSDDNGGDGFQAEWVITFPTWVSPTSQVTEATDNREWESNIVAAIYGPDAPTAGIYNDGPVALTLFVGTLGEPGWVQEIIGPEQCYEPPRGPTKFWSLCCIDTEPGTIPSARLRVNAVG